MRLVGYTDRLSAAPGDRVEAMVSCEDAEYEVCLRRLIHGDPHPDGPGVKSYEVEAGLEGRRPGRRQELRPGSHMSAPGIELPGSFAIAIWVYPTLRLDRDQAILGHTAWRERGIALNMEPDGALSLHIDGRRAATSERRLELRQWAFVTAAYDAETRQATLAIRGRDAERGQVISRAGIERGSVAGGTELSAGGAEPPSRDTEFRIAASDDELHFNGRLEAPVVFASAQPEEVFDRLFRSPFVAAGLEGALAAWDFSRSIATRRVEDLTANGHEGRLVNCPMRGVTGRLWQRREVDFRHVPEQYAAVHFHDDDLDDAGWETDFEWTVPEDLPSGVYGIELTSESATDTLPVFVRPPRGKATAPCVLVLPTFSYLAYGNDHLMDVPHIKAFFVSRGIETTYPSQAEDLYIIEQRLNSLYDRHSDGSGVCYASWHRPVVSMRPGYYEGDLSVGQGAAHQFSADLHLVDWLHERGFEFDILTDEDVHREGRELLDRYRVVLTGSHPEYTTEAMLDAYSGYVDGGGRIMYLGGNGFYWVTDLDPEEGHTIEIRRCGPATRTWDAEPGEWHLSFSGQFGGLWRFRGRAPQSVFGVGTTATGFGGTGRAYQRTEASYSDRYSFVFEGVDSEEIGAYPALVNLWGAGGFETDRYDTALGSPPGAVLAVARGFDDDVQAVVDDVTSADSKQGGTVSDKARADMAIVEHEGGGVVFSPGSISWCSCLSHNNYDNSVSRVTENVLKRFLEERVFPSTGAGGEVTGR